MYNNNKKRKETLYLVIDHTGTSPHNDIDAQELDNIDRAKSFYGCRYHYVIKRDGEVEEDNNDDDKEDDYADGNDDEDYEGGR